MASINVRPLKDRILVKLIDEDEMAPGGIIIPDTARERPQQGEVVSVGKGAILKDGTRQPMDVEVGDRVLFGKYAGSDLPRGVLKYAGEEYLILKEEEILAVLEPAAVGAKK